MPSREDCENEIIAAGDGILDRKDAQALLRKFSDRIAGSSEDPLAMARQIGDEATAAAIIEKRNRLMNLRKRVDGTELIDRQYPDLKARHGKESLYLAIHSKIDPINTVVERGRDSASSKAEEKSHLYLSKMKGDLDKLGTFDSFRNSADFQNAVGLELYEQSKAASGEPHRIGLTGNKPAQETAEAIHKWQSLAKQDLNNEGAWIGDYAGYITRTTHDGAKMWKARFEDWRNFILTKLDYEKTFEGVDNPEGFLRSAFDNLKTGIHVTNENAVGLKDPAFTSPGNLAKRLSESRDFHFKDGQSWMDYNKAFGRDQFPDQIWRSLDRSGKSWALMKMFGTNPTAEFDNYITRTYQNYRHTDPEAAEYLRNNRNTLMTQMGYLDGRLDQPVNEQMSRIAQGIRNIQSASKLGSVVFTHAFSMATKIMQLKYEGVPWGEAVGNVIGSLGVGAKGRFGREELHDLLLSNLDGRHSQMMQRWTPGEPRPGLTTSALGAVMRWQGMNYFMNAEKAGTKDMLARVLGRQLDREYGELLPETQRAFLQYGITPNDWDLLRSAPDHTQVEGRAYLTPDAAHRVAPWLDAQGNDLFTPKMRDDLAMKLYTYFGDKADASIVSPGITEKAQFYRGWEAGTAQGEVARFIAQFKMWGAANIRQNVGREWYGNPGSGTWGVPSKSQAMGIISLAALSTILGYGRMATVSALKGEVPRNPLDPRTMAAALAQGGGFGILGDLFFGESARNGQDLTDLLAGPAIGTAAQIFKIYGHIQAAAIGSDRDVRTAKKDVPPELLKLTLDNTPFINMFYARTALNYLFLWRLQEALNPGFQRRREQRIQQDNGQKFWLSPAQSVR